METSRIESIKIGKRIRQDVGDIRELAESMRTVGLLQPVVLDGEDRLIAGYRRIQAAKSLAWDRIAVYRAKTLDDALAKLRAERDENTCRKDLVVSESVAASERLRPLEEKEAKQRQESAGARGEEGGRGKKKTLPSNQRKGIADSRDKVAASVGMGHQKLERAKAVVESGDETLIAEMDRTGKVNGVFKRLKTREKAAAIAKEPPPLPKGPFRVIVADPPWEYDGRAADPTHRAANPYPSMTLDEIRAMPIEPLATKDAILWLWTTNAHLPFAFSVVEAWGFEYKTTLTWVKQKMGLGDWLRGKTEHCLMCVRGKPTVLLTNQTTAILADAGKHSAKPEAFYEMVSKLCPGSKLELFQRQPRDGWSGHGDEV